MLFIHELGPVLRDGENGQDDDRRQHDEVGSKMSERPVREFHFIHLGSVVCSLVIHTKHNEVSI